jgi:putative sterol carrier protein
MATVESIFENLPNQFKSDQAGDYSATIQFDLSGDDGGQWYVVVSDGDAAVEKGAAADPTATIKMESGDFVDMMTGQLNPMNAFMMGKVKVEGDLNSVMKFQTFFG